MQVLHLAWFETCLSKSGGELTGKGNLADSAAL